MGLHVPADADQDQRRGQRKRRERGYGHSIQLTLVLGGHHRHAAGEMRHGLPEEPFFDRHRAVSVVQTFSTNFLDRAAYEKACAAQLLSPFSSSPPRPSLQPTTSSAKGSTSATAGRSASMPTSAMSPSFPVGPVSRSRSSGRPTGGRAKSGCATIRSRSRRREMTWSFPRTNATTTGSGSTGST